MGGTNNPARSAEAYRRFKAGETAVDLAAAYKVTPRTIRNWIREARNVEAAAPPAAAPEQPAPRAPRDPEALRRARQAMDADDDLPPDDAGAGDEHDQVEHPEEGPPRRPEPEVMLHDPEEAVEIVGDLKADLAGTVVAFKYGDVLSEDDPRVVAAAKPGALLRRAIRANRGWVDPIVDGATSNPIALLIVAAFDGLRMLAKIKRAAVDKGWRPPDAEEELEGEPAAPHAQREAPTPGRPAAAPAPEPEPEGEAGPRKGIIRDAPTFPIIPGHVPIEGD